MPTQAQSENGSSLYNNPPPGTDFRSNMEQAFLRYVYSDDCPYPWVHLSQIYNSQWPRAGDMVASKIIHEKSWNGGPNNVEALKEEWHRRWGDVQGYLALKQGVDEYTREAHPVRRVRVRFRASHPYTRYLFCSVPVIFDPALLAPLSIDGLSNAETSDR
jgi:hypothetical protein